MFAMECRLPSNRVKNYGLYDQLGHVLQTSHIGVHVHHKAAVTWPYYVTWYTHWQSLMK